MVVIGEIDDQVFTPAGSRLAGFFMFGGFDLAARKVRQRLDDGWRQKIQASMIINRLSEHAIGSAEMSATQVRAAEILLKKVLPDLQATQHSGDPANPVEHKHEITVRYVKPGN